MKVSQYRALARWVQRRKDHAMARGRRSLA
jgi:hypothetical protein